MTDTATAETATAEATANVHKFSIPGTENVEMQVDVDRIPAAVRLDLLHKGIEGYVRNPVNQAIIKHNKAMEPWKAYETACGVDPAQTAVPKPEGERPVLDLVEVAKAARERLYSGNVKKSGVRKAKEKVDPLTSMVTTAVVRELFDKKSKTESGYKWTDAVKEVGGDGIKYLNGIIEARVAEGADKAELEKFMESRYIQPAKLMLGQRDTAGTKGTSLL